MGRIFLWAGQGSTIDGEIDTACLAHILHRSAGVLKGQGFLVLEVPVGLSLPKAIAWINVRSQPGDVALALETATFTSANVRGTSVFYIANNTERRTHAELLLQALAQQVPSLVNRGVHPDTDTETGSLAFTRQVNIPALVLSLGFVTNLADRTLMLERPIELASGIFKGLLPWSRRLAERGIGLPLPSIQISINGQLCSEQGILVEGNVYVPVDLLDQHAVAIPRATTAGWRHYGGITYIRAIELREAGVFVGWDAETRTALLQTLLSFEPEALGDIIGPGYLLPSDYEVFLKQINPEGLQKFPEVAQLYQAEAAIEGVNPDVAFAQALLEANFFGFSSSLKPAQNNFGGLGATGGSREFASFPSTQIGVRAHIQHLKAYANQEPLVQAVVDPRFSSISRGVAPSVEHLSWRWSAEAEYGAKILALLRRLYGSAGLL
ncbi:MAG: glucosaminidase domain-containing protein [Lyngbya sp. HA4199-MV5]|nr:glucosaminidase domain-containing protein [Lyngbya sp. HA4199-MV5]